MKTDNLTQMPDPFHDRLGTVRTALAAWPDGLGKADIHKAEAVLSTLEAGVPPTPTATPHAVVATLADAAVAAALAGKPLDLHAASAKAVAAYDAERVAHAAAVAASTRARSLLAQAVLGHAAGAYAAWSERAGEIGEEYLALYPTGSELDARRAGGKALQAWTEAYELRQEWALLTASWKGLRLLQGNGSDADVHRTSAVVANRNGASFDKIDSWARRAPAGTTFLDVMAHHGISALVLPSRRQQLDNEARMAEVKEKRALVYVTNLTTPGGDLTEEQILSRR